MRDLSPMPGRYRPALTLVLALCLGAAATATSAEATMSASDSGPRTGPRDTPSSDGAASARYRVVDDSGDTVTLAHPARRIVALSPHLVEIAYAAGAGSALVGTVEGSDAPAAAQSLPRVGSYRGISVEAIVALEPDLILAWGSGTPPETLEKLESLGMAVYRSEPRALDDIAATIAAVGRLSGHATAGRRAADAFERGLAETEQTLDPAPRVFYQLGHEPLTTLAKGQIVTQVIRHCGGEPLFDDSPVIVPQIDRESLVLAAPQVILAAGKSDDWKAQWQGQEAVPAVRDGNLYTLSPDAISRPGPRMLDAVDEVCQALSGAAAKGTD
ncbi:cobalamin-binding protein [Salinicola aestuarinus]|uniref:cobalamin-binding protein n=1 Tax=Salinicola aestuarinus TaxID=1949082 RepID=UPI0013008D4E|nr:cobalamin-binding protein [Salinicola aestuarinus]